MSAAKTHFAYMQTWLTAAGPQQYYGDPLCGVRKTRLGQLKLTNRHADVTCGRCAASLGSR